jgi:hypothetical protein
MPCFFDRQDWHLRIFLGQTAQACNFLIVFCIAIFHDSHFDFLPLHMILTRIFEYLLFLMFKFDRKALQTGKNELLEELITQN